ncbi:MAG: hypothetical protein QME49_06675 [bacterium]|nr:hypothetical protein [bacterium]
MAADLLRLACRRYKNTCSCGGDWCPGAYCPGAWATTEPEKLEHRVLGVYQIINIRI